MARAAVAAGADGVLIEVHPEPDRALSDGAQSLYPTNSRSSWVSCGRFLQRSAADWLSTHSARRNRGRRWRVERLCDFIGPEPPGRARRRRRDSRSARTGARSATAALNHASSVYGHVTTARGTFEQTIDNPQSRAAQTRRAAIFNRSGRRGLDIRFTNPAGDRIVADGKWVWVYLPSATPDQVVRMPVSRRP